MKLCVRLRRLLPWAWRCSGQKSTFFKLIGLVCVMCVLLGTVHLPGLTDPGVQGRDPGEMNIGIRLRPAVTSKTSPHVFRIKEVQGEQFTYYDIPTLGKRFVKREKRVMEVCRDREKELLGLSSEKWAYERIEVNRNIHTLYCPLLKVGSTFWRRVFHAIRQNETIITPYDVGINQALLSKRETLKELLPLNKSSTGDFLRSSVNIMFVREPFSRLLSGYIDKLFAPNPYFWSAIGKFIVKNYRRNPSGKSLKCGHDVTFGEFVKYVIDTEKNNKPQRDAHFTPTYDQCKPCQIHYNAIGKMESFNEDTAYIFHILGYNVSVNSLKLWAGKAEEDAVIDSTISPFSWKKAIKKCMSFHEAAKRIWHKMQIRGIVRKDIKMPFSEREIRTASYKRFVKALLDGRGSKADKDFLKMQKHEVLQKVYHLVPSEDIEQIKKLFKPDFELFGYDFHPKHIFPDSSISTPANDWLFNLSSV